MKQTLTPLLCAAFLLLVFLSELGCARISIDTIRLTRDRFPAKQSTQEVQPLAQAPTRPYHEIADLVARGKSATFERLQQKILQRAAALGADAVIFSRPEEHVKEGIAYHPAYTPWGSHYDPPTTDQTRGGMAGEGTDASGMDLLTVVMWLYPMRLPFLHFEAPQSDIPSLVPKRLAAIEPRQITQPKHCRQKSIGLLFALCECGVAQPTTLSKGGTKRCRPRLRRWLAPKQSESPSPTSR